MFYVMLSGGETDDVMLSGGETANNKWFPDFLCYWYSVEM